MVHIISLDVFNLNLYNLNLMSCISRFDKTVTCVYILAGRDCPPDYTRCGGSAPSRRCIRSSWLCDGDNDCGNNWDENPQNCGESR